MTNLFPSTRMRQPGTSGGMQPPMDPGGMQAPAPMQQSPAQQSQPQTAPSAGPAPSAGGFGDFLQQGANPSNMATSGALAQNAMTDAPPVVGTAAYRPAINGRTVVLGQQAAAGNRAALQQLVSELGINLSNWELGNITVNPAIVQQLQRLSVGLDSWDEAAFMRALGAQMSMTNPNRPRETVPPPVTEPTPAPPPTPTPTPGGGVPNANDPRERAIHEWETLHPGQPVPDWIRNQQGSPQAPTPMPVTGIPRRNNYIQPGRRPSNGIYTG